MVDMHPVGGPVRGRVLVVDGEAAVRDALRRALEAEGYEVEAAGDGREALRLLESVRPDAVLLDAVMPAFDGLATTRRIRAGGGDVPILMLSGRDGVAERVAALDSGADDFLGKPFAVDELCARVRALIRRSAYRWRAAGPVREAGHELAFEDLVLNTLTRVVTRAGHRLDLTRTEYALLRLFMTHPRQVLPRALIHREVWGFDFEPASNTLDVYVMYLRRKTEARGLPRLIHTERGTGYVLRSRVSRGVPARRGAVAGPVSGTAAYAGMR